MPLQIIRNDITRVRADAIVNTANPDPVVGGGTDSAIYKAAGEEKLLEARRKIGPIERGQAAWTPAFGLKAKYIIHTVGPAWIDGTRGERELLRSCYEKSLALAEQLKCRSVAFPLISSGVYGFPESEALTVALSAIEQHLMGMEEELRVTLVVFGSSATALSARVMDGIEEYIGEAEVEALKEEEYSRDRTGRERRRMQNTMIQRPSKASAPRPAASASFDTFGSLYGAGKTAKAPAAPGLESYLPGKKTNAFRERLFQIIDARGLKDPEVYKRAYLSKQVFSKIRSKEDYKPSKNTVLALGIALKLSLPEMEDLLRQAGFALAPGDLTDCIVRFYLDREEYDIAVVNFALYEHHCPPLGSF